MPIDETRTADDDGLYALDERIPFGNLLGIGMRVDDDATAVAALDVRPEHRNSNGVAHGGIAYSLVDTAMGAATMASLGRGARCATIDIQIRYTRPAFGDRLVTTAVPVKTGSRVVHLSAEVHDENEELVAYATGSFAALPSRE